MYIFNYLFRIRIKIKATTEDGRRVVLNQDGTNGLGFAILSSGGTFTLCILEEVWDT